MALTLDGTNGITVPTWTTAGRPGSPSAGQFGFNTTLGYIEWYSTSSSLWLPIYSGPSYAVSYLIVGGGGGGGPDIGGGGGAGAYVEGSSFSAVVGAAYSITVGAGGSSQSNGNNSSFLTTTSTGSTGVPNTVKTLLETSL